MSTCDVCIGGWDGLGDEPAEFYLEQVVTARKPHKCFECGTVIERGHKYERVSGKWDGECDRFTFCLFCAEVSKVFSCGEGRQFGILWDDMHEVAFPKLTTASPCFRELSPESKAKLLDKWKHWKFDHSTGARYLQRKKNCRQERKDRSPLTPPALDWFVPDAQIVRLRKAYSKAYADRALETPAIKELSRAALALLRKARTAGGQP